MTKTIATKVAPRALRSIRSGHPWVFEHSIREWKSKPEPGDLAVVFDDNRRFVGIGLADPDSAIAIRILHHGTSAKIDSAFFAGRVAQAISLREPLLRDGHTDGMRLVNGENDGLPGLVVDRYASVLVIKIYTEAWLPHLDDIVGPLVEHFSPEAIVLRASRTAQPALPSGEGVIHGDLRSPTVSFKENGLVFNADVISGNKTGHFLDQRENRQRVRDLSNNASVLDVFSSTGGFSVYAAAGGARTITAVDISAGAIDAAKVNVRANGLKPSSNFEAIRGDAFEVMSMLRKRSAVFDIVVVDPPSFAPKQADIPKAIAAYRRLTRAAVPLVAPDGLLVQASCSARVTEDEFVTTITSELERSHRTFGRLQTFGHPLDHPATFAEGHYLKAVFARTA